MHGSMWRELETEAPGNGHRSEAARQGKPGEKWLRDLTSDNATAPAPDPTSHVVGVVFSRSGPCGGDTEKWGRSPGPRHSKCDRQGGADGDFLVAGAGAGEDLPSRFLWLPAGAFAA